MFSQLSVREKEPVCRMKCVFTLDFVDVKLDFTGTSAKLVSMSSITAVSGLSAFYENY